MFFVFRQASPSKLFLKLGSFGVATNDTKVLIETHLYSIIFFCSYAYIFLFKA